MRRIHRYLIALFSLAALLMTACPTSDDPGQVLTLKITEKNDSLLHFDSVIVTVRSKDGKFSQDVFHGILRDPKQVEAMSLDSRVGQDYTVNVIGYRAGKIGVNKEITFTGSQAESKDIPIKDQKPETVVVVPDIPEILITADTSVSEGDSLRLHVIVKNPWSGAAKLTLKDGVSGARLDTLGGQAEGYFSWRPGYDQGRTEPYAIAFTYAMGDRSVGKTIHIQVRNVNRPPKLVPIPDQKVKESETLSFKVEASDPDHDSLVLTALNLPTGAVFSSGNFSWKPSEGQAGNYSVRFKAQDGSDSGYTDVLISVGNVEPPPPVIVKITYPGRDTVLNKVTLNVQYTVNGTSFQRKIDLVEGKNRVRIDTAILGRTGLDTITITLDTMAPNKPVVTCSTPTNILTPIWKWAGGGGGIGLFRFRLDSEDFSAAATTGDTSYTPSRTQDIGSHTLFVQERDSAGNWSGSGKCTVRIDTSGPSLPLVSVTPTSPTNNRRPIWSWKSGGNGDLGHYRYRLDTVNLGGVQENSSTTFQPTQDLGDGSHTLYVQEKDSAGNWSKIASNAVLVDTKPPNAPIVTVPSLHTTDQKPRWNWTSGGNSGGRMYRVRLDDPMVENGPTEVDTTFFVPSGNLPFGSHTLYVQERDSAGNWSPSGSHALKIHGPIGYAVGYGGSIFKSTNGGTIWTPKHNDFSNRLVSVYFVNSSLGFAVGEGGIILRTTDGGTYWGPCPTPTGVELRSVYFVNASLGFIAGWNGVILKTTNGGDSWTIVPSGTSENLFSIQMFDDYTGFACGEHGIVLKTTNGGAYWETLTTGTTQRLLSLTLTDDNTIYAAGGGGTIIKTANGGTTWSALSTGTNSQFFNSVYFVNANQGYAVGGPDTLLTTSNAGKTWKAVSMGQSQYFEFVYFVDSNTGFAVGGNTDIAWTTDGGATWTLVPIQSPTSLVSLYFP